MAPGVVSQPASAKDDAHVAVLFPPLGEDPGVSGNGEVLKGPRPIIPDDEYEKLRLAGHLPWKTHFYDAQKPFLTLFSFHNTAFKLVLMRTDFWFIMLLHIFLCVMYYEVSDNPVLVPSSNGSQQDWPFVSATTIAITGAMLVFFLVFHTNQAYNRFWELYNRTASADGRINNRLLPHMRVKFQDGAFPEARETRMFVGRKLMAMYYLSYAHLPFYKNSPVFEWAWNKCIDHGLLTPEEAAALKAIPSGKPHKELAVWVGKRLEVHLRRGDISVESFNVIFEYSNDVIANVGVLYDYTAMPVPFAFFHVLNFILFIYMLLVAYTYTMFSYYYSIIGVFLTALSLLGLRELAIVLSDPLGNDDIDLPVFDYALNVHNYVDKCLLSEPET